MKHCRRAIALFFRDRTLRFELFLLVWLACALLYRMFVVLYADFEVSLLATSPLRTSTAEVNVVIIWILLGVAFLSGVRRMSAVVSELRAFEQFLRILWMLVRNLLILHTFLLIAEINVVVMWTLLGVLSGVLVSAVVSELKDFKRFLWVLVWNLLTLLPSFLLYDFWLINFIYTTWTSKFLVVFQTLQLFPSAGILAHSVYQFCFISMVKQNMCSKRKNVNLSCVAVLNAAVNLVMLLHLLCTFIVLCKTQPSHLWDAIWLMALELLFRVVGLVAFVHMFIQQLRHHHTTISRRDETEFEYEKSKTTLVYAVASFSPLTEEVRHRVFPPSLEGHEIVPEQVRDQNFQSSSLVMPKPALHTKSQPQQSLYVIGLMCS